MNGQEGTIYTDSKYVCGILHTFGKIWMEGGLINTKGKELAHVRLIEKVLEAATLPGKIVVIPVEGHQRVRTFEEGNRLVDEEAKNVAEGQSETNNVFSPNFGIS